jgi:hypothetical protein
MKIAFLARRGHMLPDDARLGDLPVRTMLNLALDSAWYLMRDM